MKKIFTLIPLLVSITTKSASLPSANDSTNVENPLPQASVKNIEIKIYYSANKIEDQQLQDSNTIYLRPKMRQAEKKQSRLSEIDRIHDHLCNDRKVWRRNVYIMSCWFMANDIDTDVILWEYEEEKSQSMLLQAHLSPDTQKKKIYQSIKTYLLKKKALQS